MQHEDRMFNTIQHLERRTITSDSDVETDCLIEIANAIEDAYDLRLMNECHGYDLDGNPL